MTPTSQRAARLAMRLALVTWWPYLAFLGALEHWRLIVTPLWQSHGEEIKRRFLYDRQALLWEYEEVRNYIEELYPNLDWTIEKGKLDLEKLDRETVAAIDASTTREEGARAIRRFVRAFDDPHLYTVRKERREALAARRLKPPDTLSFHTPAAMACTAFLDLDGAEPVPTYTSLDGHPDFSPVEEPSPFPSGTLRLPSGRRLGVVRIDSFAYDYYETTCHAAWERFRWTIRGTCEWNCRVKFWDFFRNSLIDTFSAEVRRLIEADVDGLVLDLAGNPGGYDWYQGVIRTLTPLRIPCPKTNVVRSVEARYAFEAQVDTFRRALRKGPCGQERSILEEGLRRAETLLEETSKPCGRDWVFPAPETAQELQKAVYDDNGDPIRDPGAPKDCSGVTAAEFYQCGLFSHLEIGTARDPSIQRPLFDQLVDTFRPGLWKGPLAVVVDKYTYSSAETAAGMLQDWAGAVVIGEPTAGAGAGNFFSFEPIDLPVSGLQLFLPDATAWRRDGRNYREGVTPDIRVWWYREDAWDVRARKLGAQLRAMNLRPDA